VKAKFLLVSSMILTTVGACAAPILGTGTPGNSILATPTGPTPRFGTLFNFDSLTPGTTFSPTQYAAQGVSISSPDGLLVDPFSTQSSPNELFDNSATGSANIAITTGVTNELGIGIADSDPTIITLQALNASGAAFGPLFTVTIPRTGVNSGNGYFTISDTAYDIYGLEIQSAGNSNFSGLAIDDLQVAPAPEPASLALCGAGSLLLLCMSRRSKSS
jgi:hypothetical protein